MNFCCMNRSDELQRERNYWPDLLTISWLEFFLSNLERILPHLSRPSGAIEKVVWPRVNCEVVEGSRKLIYMGRHTISLSMLSVFLVFCQWGSLGDFSRKNYFRLKMFCKTKVILKKTEVEIWKTKSFFPPEHHQVFIFSTNILFFGVLLICLAAYNLISPRKSCDLQLLDLGRRLINIEILCKIIHELLRRGKIQQWG